MRTIIKLAITALILHATWRAGSAYFRYYQFRDGVTQTSQFSGARREDELHARVMELARELQVPVEPQNVNVRREDNHTLIDARYTEQIEVVPRYFYPWEFKVNVDTFTIVPKEIR